MLAFYINKLDFKKYYVNKYAYSRNLVEGVREHINANKQSSENEGSNGHTCNSNDHILLCL